MLITACSTLQDEVVALLPALRNFARRFVFSETDVDDLTQETVGKMLAHLDSFTPGTKLRSWAFTIMRNTYMTEYKRQKRVQLRNSDDGLFEIPVAGRQQLCIYTADVRSALARLPTYQRDALLMIVDGLSYDDAARLSGCEIGTIKSRVSRARATLVKILGENSIRSAASIQ
ncbi:RNA polymerase sigma-70 factor (ECF subfamily) [Rhizobium sp. ERR 922]|uniref:DNA-directed RNA polymerase sigma-70 factor n=1 Tax=Rhizobium dioscoreae TaxID=2653122 RepID=A0ABQ0Z7G2_9HYPH|nr:MULTISPECIES: sigma-70 family RNA polymerase sigma factor [Rhizobium]MCZ3374793.1 sigma-70 family RNA polymerase sigma factor [Rhizobium sp. AG207R]TWB13581.1 RNA polymerase sigma-70 factor (ECF subfamily) [Rhizobium sp. ERR1071]TWB48395.1 RNA polymerase sigma-70 factor (ECF subfamily) [Rhizobium sp. ERR 922]TWB90116.1 RNA polymerase sigma-70 factor (ECF subfamily) [Rhizobium sp. ERR 942]GES41298.1 DNA-directed RNA polymerase sigma-70 factor [Rhizobium dioscoreae]